MDVKRDTAGTTKGLARVYVLAPLGTQLEYWVIRMVSRANRRRVGGYGIRAAARRSPPLGPVKIRALLLPLFFAPFRSGHIRHRRSTRPPDRQRGITLSPASTSADGNQLRKLGQRLGDGQLQIPIAASYRAAGAAQAELSSSRPDLLWNGPGDARAAERKHDTLVHGCSFRRKGHFASSSLTDAHGFAGPSARG